MSRTTDASTWPGVLYSEGMLVPLPSTNRWFSAAYDLNETSARHASDDRHRENYSIVTW
jgi:hypothetical protein